MHNTDPVRPPGSGTWPPKKPRAAGEDPLGLSALFSCQRAILPTLVKTADLVNVAIRLTGCGERFKWLWCGLFLEA